MAKSFVFTRNEGILEESSKKKEGGRSGNRVHKIFLLEGFGLIGIQLPKEYKDIFDVLSEVVSLSISGNSRHRLYFLLGLLVNKLLVRVTII